MFSLLSHPFSVLLCSLSVKDVVDIVVFYWPSTMPRFRPTFSQSFFTTQESMRIGVDIIRNAYILKLCNKLIESHLVDGKLDEL